jgi:hypothetical protein
MPLRPIPGPAATLRPTKGTTMNNAGNTRPGAGGRLAELTAYECWGLLDSEEIARVAWQGREGVAIVPVNYTVADGSGRPARLAVRQPSPLHPGGPRRRHRPQALGFSRRRLGTYRRPAAK